MNWQAPAIDRTPVQMPVASNEPPAEQPSHRKLQVGRELGRNLWLALTLLYCFAKYGECPRYSSYLFGTLVEPIQLSYWGEVSLTWLVLAKSALALLVVVPLCFWLAIRGRTRLERFVLSAWVTLVILWLFVDQIVFVMSGHHAVEYLGLVLNPDAWQWAGDSSKLLGQVCIAGGLTLTTIWGAFEAISLLDRAVFRQPCTNRDRLFSVGGWAALVLVILGWPLPRLAVNSADARLLSHFERNLAWCPAFCEVNHSSGFMAKSELRERASQAYSHAMLKLSDQPLDHRFQIKQTERRHVVLLILESFRRDLLVPEIMPNSAKLADEGMFLQRHYSNSNMSHYGLFSLLYGRLPYLYDALLDRQVQPQACETFRNSGYRNVFITSGDCSNWLRMEEFLNDRTFDEVTVFKQDSWVDRDRKALARVGELLKADPSEHPQFIVCFLMSTHFPYEFPLEFQRFEPTAMVKDVLALSQNRKGFVDPEAMRNRQRNAASFLDAEIQQLVTSLDQTQTTLVMTGDHAESFNDDGYYFHGSRLSDAQTMVPVVFWGANVPQQKIRHMTSHVDVFPTLCSLLTNGRAVPDNLHGGCVSDRPLQVFEQALLVHGRMTSRNIFQRALLVSPECRLPMLLHRANGAGITLMDPVDARDRILSDQPVSVDMVAELSARIEAAFRVFGPARMASDRDGDVVDQVTSIKP